MLDVLGPEATALTKEVRGDLEQYWKHNDLEADAGATCPPLAP